jgi:hypothetical protein
MEENQLIYPTARLLANPKVFFAIANWFEGPDMETIAGAFYDLMEHDITESEDPSEAMFEAAEVCFREKPEEEGTFQVILSTGNAIELRPSEDGDTYAAVRDTEDLALVSTIYSRLVKAIEEARPDLQGDIALIDVPTPANGYLRDEDGDAFRGSFHLLSDPEKKFAYVVDVVDLDSDDLKARIL